VKTKKQTFLRGCGLVADHSVLFRVITRQITSDSKQQGKKKAHNVVWGVPGRPKKREWKCDPRMKKKNLGSQHGPNGMVASMYTWSEISFCGCKTYRVWGVYWCLKNIGGGKSVQLVGKK